MSDSVNLTTPAAPPSTLDAKDATQFVTPPLLSGIRYACIPVWSILLCFGIFGNALTVFVLRTKRLQQSSTSFYLTALAITDMLYLLTSLVASIANFIFFFPSELRQLSRTFCVFTPFLSYTLAYISVWLLVTVTVERAVWVVLPFRARHICTKRTAKSVVLLLVIGFTLLDIHFFLTMRYQEVRPGYWLCMTTYFSDKVFPFLDLLLVAILPCTIMLVANCLIGWKLRVMRKFRSGTAIGMVSNNITDQGGGEKREKSVNLTRMLVSTNVFFIVSVTPLLIYDVVFFSVDVRAWAEEAEEVRGGMIFAIERFVYTLWYTNFAIHFLLYCLSGPPFRAEVLVLFNRLRDRIRKVAHKSTVDQTELKRPETGLTSTANVVSTAGDVYSREELL
ncbi:Pyroglutamylated RFamide peptide receptor [Echinococcus granulosus]|uniref:Growth hormone secretagogue receptor type 1 n=1 Tax=Echinococcus granulosus TaxID=6210 RepID=U6J6W1_ECHGR|nr:Pyroglutamylated RFamide peptide receptor [Echinococcus granulosus]EUB62827.1 Pyroglutamylated RFamide peptide receptor [Echinococcus granulosus]KAH9280378.1 Pyroglutamylated RFamide peptide receptor [Echinococcus granulosus]CDS19051.1 growth hormone secretagogue receptor type 1 [Echinococcus granulosus]